MASITTARTGPTDVRQPIPSSELLGLETQLGMEAQRFSTLAAPATLDPNKFTTVWREDFENNSVGQLSRVWGNVTLQDNGPEDGELILKSLLIEDYRVNSGAMQPPTGASANQGYGLYSVTVKTDDLEGPGPYAALWPSTDVWPGPELDVFEKQGKESNTNGYSTIHWRGQDGKDHYDPHFFGNIDMSQKHTYAMEWAADHITLYIDGTEIYTTTANVPKDFADGGENSAWGVGMQANWTGAAAQNGDNVLHVYDISYAKPVSAPPPPPPPPPAQSTSPSAGDDRITGTASSNTINALAGNDWVSGLGGSDILSGGDGNDTLIGGSGVDRLSGNLGSDTFRYASAGEGNDMITDFVSGSDHIEVSAAGFGGRLAAGSTASFIANTSGRATSSSGTGQFVYETDVDRLWWDADGGGTGGRQLVASFTNNPTLISGDLTIIA